MGFEWRQLCLDLLSLLVYSGVDSIIMAVWHVPNVGIWAAADAIRRVIVCACFRYAILARITAVA
ncbi:hypothetical protein L873DRAFT_1803844 [Choiromyces venosus 120613-1]|uniref:Uncharacterized protein n=1 Tax=Choiromyces venosus 120613-1 TaxID=1336337 RepID=A0A3N4JYW4_9PEZI|nr:hypothetical protein L873DRAFT_1803844 [Choiromyces venosus 120613-1]